ncbi:MAG: flagellar basal body P-ring biosynthesis protein FlgA [Planctomycetes bacterium ADurb.Bin412]|nr:MAG: flagellar basal body P-ring biosynthesis protein FlgA [Planctomycetes bacterium ADurb.Bin412]
MKTNCAEQTADLPPSPLTPQKESAVLSIPESILSELSSQEPNDDIAGITLSDQLTDTVAQMMDLDTASLKIEWQCKDPSWLQQPAAGDRFKIVPLSPIRLGQVQFAVTDLSLREPENRRQGDPGRCKVSGKVEFLCESVVAAQALRPGQVITPEMVKRMPRRVTSFREVGITDLDYVVGQEVARAAGENELVLPGMIRKVQLVKRNEYVDVIAKVGQVEIRQRCKALAGGAYGDVILARDENNKRTVQGRITAARQVTVMEESVPEKEVLLSKDFISSASEKRYQEN